MAAKEGQELAGHCPSLPLKMGPRRFAQIRAAPVGSLVILSYLHTALIRLNLAKMVLFPTGSLGLGWNLGSLITHTLCQSPSPTGPPGLPRIEKSIGAHAAHQGTPLTLSRDVAEGSSLASLFLLCSYKTEMARMLP